MTLRQLQMFEALIQDHRYADFVRFMPDAEQRHTYMMIVLAKFDITKFSIQEFIEDELAMMTLDIEF